MISKPEFHIMKIMNLIFNKIGIFPFSRINPKNRIKHLQIYLNKALYAKYIRPLTAAIRQRTTDHGNNMINPQSNKLAENITQ